MRCPHCGSGRAPIVQEETDTFESRIGCLDCDKWYNPKAVCKASFSKKPEMINTETSKTMKKMVDLFDQIKSLESRITEARGKVVHLSGEIAEMLNARLAIRSDFLVCAKSVGLCESTALSTFDEGKP